MDSGLSDDDIKYESDNNNIFQMSSKGRAQRASRNLLKRIAALPENIVALFPSLDMANQKIVALLAFMLINQLLDDFMYEAYRDELVLGDRILEDYEVEAFMMHKQTQVAQMANWSEQSITKIKRMLKTMLRDAGLLEAKDHVVQPFLDSRLEECMNAAGLQRQLASFKGIS